MKILDTSGLSLDAYCANPEEKLLIIPPKSPGIPCKLCIPHVSCKFIFFLKYGPKNKNPNVDTIPAIVPIIIEITPVTTKSEAPPIDTPPANVAFNTTSISNFFLIIRLTAHAAMQLDEILKTVFTTTLCWLIPGANPPLKLGQ